MLKDTPEGATYFYPVAESRARLEDTIKAMLPKEKEEYHPFSQYKSDIAIAYNDAIQEVHALVPAVIEKVYEDLRGKIDERIEEHKANWNPEHNLELEDKMDELKYMLSLLSTKTCTCGGYNESVTGEMLGCVCNANN